MSQFREEKFDDLKFQPPPQTVRSTLPYEGLDVRGLVLKKQDSLSQEHKRQNPLEEEKVKLDRLLEETARVMRAFELAVGELQKSRQKEIEELPQKMVELSLKIAGRIVAHEINTQPDILLRCAQEIIKEVTGKKKNLCLNDADLALLRQCRPEQVQSLEQVTGLVLSGDPAIPRGSCRLEADDFEIDGSFSRRLQYLWEELLGKTPEKES